MRGVVVRSYIQSGFERANYSPGDRQGRTGIIWPVILLFLET